MADRSRQTMAGFSVGAAGFLGLGVALSSQVASDACFAGMVLSAVAAIVMYLGTAVTRDPYRDAE